MKVDRLFRCDAMHHFDIAKEGYVNLLVAQRRQSKDPGYSKSMIASRRDFFDAGHYERLGAGLADIAAGCLDTANVTGSRPIVVDAGCGEGYYLRKIRQHYELRGSGAPVLCGIDISKPGVQTAARRDRLGHYAVASTHALPLLPGVADLVLTHFSPVFAESFLRVLQPNGVVLVGGPGPQHLLSLKALVYETPQEHTPSDPLHDDVRFQRIGTYEIQYGVELRNTTDISNLLAMTPFYWSANQDTQDRLSKLDKLDIPVDVVVHAYRRS